MHTIFMNFENVKHLILIEYYSIFGQNKLKEK